MIKEKQIFDVIIPNDHHRYNRIEDFSKRLKNYVKSINVKRNLYNDVLVRFEVSLLPEVLVTNKFEQFLRSQNLIGWQLI